ncbi:MBG-2 domain-containing protein, partial [Methylobacterium oryzihabitans]|uniref:MBG-2 domain-containing protein n=1 Tax=Methylobacterium oryzihabitans TaxID=2499852 RepID=UPI001651D440
AVTGGNGSAANYALPPAATLTIAPAGVTVRANDGRSTYGDAPVDPGLSATGLAPGEGVGVLTGLSSGLRLDAASPAGTYPLTVTGWLANPNYRIVATQAGTFTVAPRPLVVTADPLTRLVGDPDPVLTYTLGGRGLVNGDRLTGALASTAGADGAPGPYRITQGSLAAPADYVLDFVGAELAVLARPSRPAPVAVAVDATGLASTAERAARLDARPVEPDLPLRLVAGPEGVLRVSDPRFDATLVCTGRQGGCFLAPLAPAPRPQAGPPAPAP